MHAQAGTIGYETILDEEARQKAKQASRERTFGAPVVSVPLIGATSTPSTAVSPAPHDTEAHREAARLEASLRLKTLPVSHQHRLAVSAPLEVAQTPVERLLVDLGHLHRQTVESAGWHRAGGRLDEGHFRDGEADAYVHVIERLKAL